MSASPRTTSTVFAGSARGPGNEEGLRPLSAGTHNGPRGAPGGWLGTPNASRDTLKMEADTPVVLGGGLASGMECPNLAKGGPNRAIGACSVSMGDPDVRSGGPIGARGHLRVAL